MVERTPPALSHLVTIELAVEDATAVTVTNPSRRSRRRRCSREGGRMREQKREKEAAKPSLFLLGIVAAAEEDASKRERTRGVTREDALTEKEENEAVSSPMIRSSYC
ncbi:hypothetical protein HN51_061210 [Arachis hypogaea]|nr:uncharacterized protein DS421_11g320160 [Arachis hypogaea]